MVHKCWSIKGNMNMMHGIYNAKIVIVPLLLS